MGLRLPRDKFKQIQCLCEAVKSVCEAVKSVHEAVKSFHEAVKSVHEAIKCIREAVPLNPKPYVEQELHVHHMRIVHYALPRRCDVPPRLYIVSARMTCTTTNIQ